MDKTVERGTGVGSDAPPRLITAALSRHAAVAKLGHAALAGAAEVHRLGEVGGIAYLTARNTRLGHHLVGLDLSTHNAAVLRRYRRKQSLGLQKHRRNHQIRPG